MVRIEIVKLLILQVIGITTDNGRNYISAMG